MGVIAEMAPIKKERVERVNKVLKTPYFMIDKQALDIGFSKLMNALTAAWPNFIIGYSYKTNALPWIINYFKEKGCYAEVVSDDEYELAESIGIDKAHLIYNGLAKSKESFLEAIRNHAIVNIDSEKEIDWLDEVEKNKYSVGIRVNFDLELMCPGQTQYGAEGGRFGFCYENGELKKAIERIESKGVRLSGLHLHKSSKTRIPAVYKSIAKVAVEIATKYNLNLDYVDIGGGFFGGLENKPKFSEYFDIVASVMSEKFDPEKVALIVEPGVSLIGAYVDYVTSVVDVKKTTRNQFVITDGSRIQIDPLMTKFSYFHEVIRQGRLVRKKIKRQIITGFTCMENDRLLDIKDELELISGDIIVYHKMGAYTMCLTPLFIKWLPDVYVQDGEQIYIVRKKWKTFEYRSGCIVK